MALEYPDSIDDVDKIPEGKLKEATLVESIEDEDTKQFFGEVFTTADDARRPREDVWRTAWALYNGQYNWSAKADWQSKTNIPKVRDAVDRAAATFRRALVRIKRFYGIESETKLGVQKGLFTISLMDFWLDRANFINEFTTGLKSGLITSTMVFKTWWKYEEEMDIEVTETIKEELIKEDGVVIGSRPVPVRKVNKTTKTVGKLGFTAVDPFKFWIVPHTNSKSVIEKTEVSVADLISLSKKGFYRKEAVDAIITGRKAEEVKLHAEAERKGETVVQGGTHIRPVELFHYWGDIYNKDGEVLMRNARFTMAGKDVVLRRPQANPFLHGKAPYVWGTPYIVPFSTYNRGIVEDIIGIAGMITELSNLVIDGAHFDAIRAFQIDVDLLYNQSEADSGIYPGKTLRYKGADLPTDRDVVKPIEVGHVPSSILGVLDYLDREYQISTAVTELISGGPDRRGARTATEITTKSASAQEGLDDAARTVEDTVMNPMLEMVSKVIYQYHEDFQMPRLLENFPETALLLTSLEPEERYAVMVGGFVFKAKGISVMLDKAQNLERIVSFIQLVSQLPGILQRINIDALLEEVVVSLGWNPQKMLVNPASPAVVPAASGTGASPSGAQPPGAGTQTPAQISAGQQGAQLGGANNNPLATPPQALEQSVAGSI